MFGYGSLVWRPAFPFVERRVAVLDGWARRFWQGSTDHRGVPGAPGRVVTLVPEPRARVGGVAYRIAPAHREEVLARLDHREQGGYLRARAPVRAPAGPPFARALVYLATPRNPNWLGPASLETIAAQVAESRGPSGANDEYVRELAVALDAAGVPDAHVAALDHLLRARRPARPGPQATGSPPRAG